MANYMKFYFKAGAIIFFFMGIFNSYSLFFWRWGFMDLGLKVSGVLGIIFNFLMAYLFVYLQKQLPSDNPKPNTNAMPTDQDLNNLINDAIEKSGITDPMPLNKIRRKTKAKKTNDIKKKDNSDNSKA